MLRSYALGMGSLTLFTHSLVGGLTFKNVFTLLTRYTAMITCVVVTRIRNTPLMLAEKCRKEISVKNSTNRKKRRKNLMDTNYLTVIGMVRITLDVKR